MNNFLLLFIYSFLPINSFEPLVVSLSVLQMLIMLLVPKNWRIFKEKKAANSHEIACEFHWLPALIENPGLCPFMPGKIPGLEPLLRALIGGTAGLGFSP